MGRSAQDAALLLSALAGPDPRAPLAIDEPGEVFRRPLARSFKGARIAWSRNLGRYPVEPRVNAVCDSVRGVFADLGCVVEDAEPDFKDADEIFQTLRAWQFAAGHEAHSKTNRALVKDTVIWNAEQGLRLSGLDVARAEEKRAALYERVRTFLERYEYLLLPVSQVAPFPVEVRWVREIAGVPMKTYIDWMATCYAITLTGLPAASVPAGFTPEGLPVGLQIVGRHHQDFAVLQLAHAFETATGFGKKRPPVAVTQARGRCRRRRSEREWALAQKSRSCFGGAPRGIRGGSTSIQPLPSGLVRRSCDSLPGAAFERALRGHAGQLRVVVLLRDVGEHHLAAGTPQAACPGTAPRRRSTRGRADPGSAPSATRGKGRPGAWPDRSSTPGAARRSRRTPRPWCG